MLSDVAPNAGTFPLTLRVSDPDGASATIGATFPGGVSDSGPPVPHAFSIAYTQTPVWITSAILAVARGAPYQIQIKAQDPDGDPLTFRLAGGLISALGMTLSPSGLLSIPRNFPARQMSVEVSDRRGGVAVFSPTPPRRRSLRRCRRRPAPRRLALRP